MPRIRSCDPRIEARKQDLRNRYGGFMTLTDIAGEFGCKSRNTARKAVAHLPSYSPTGAKVYDVADIAKLIEESRQCGTN